MCVHAITLLYYIFEPGVERCLMLDAFGRPLHPMRYVMWTISVSSMCVSLYLVTEGSLSQTRRDEKRAISREETRDKLVDALLATVFTFLFGFLGSRVNVEGTLWPNVAFFLMSSASFYLKLYRLWAMLGDVTGSGRVVRSGNAPQFVVIRVAVVIVWHVFPCVWVLGAFNAITPFEEHLGYVLGDLCAKYLLLFVYISHVNG